NGDFHRDKKLKKRDSARRILLRGVPLNDRGTTLDLNGPLHEPDELLAIRIAAGRELREVADLCERPVLGVLAVAEHVGERRDRDTSAGSKSTWSLASRATTSSVEPSCSANTRFAAEIESM